MPKGSTCKTVGCDAPVWRKWMCELHYWEANPPQDCDEPGCTNPAKNVKGGPCKKHKTQRERAATAERTCTVEGCNRPQHATGVCISHYTRPGMLEGCSIDGCHNTVYRRGMCASHERQDREADPTRQRCSVDGCDRVILAQGVCSLHYKKLRVHGDVNYVRPEPEVRICSVEGCEREVVHSSLCNRHMLRNRRHGDPQATGLLIVAEIKRDHYVTPERHHVSVWSYYGRPTEHVLHDPEDCALVCEEGWWVSPMGYALRWVQSAGKHEFLHRRIMNLGFLTDMGEVVDHVSGVKLDNRRSNLRVVTQAFNMQNRATVTNRGTSRFRGVAWDVKRQRWEAYVKVEGRKHHVGLFGSEKSAADAVHAFRVANGIPEYGPAA